MNETIFENSTAVSDLNKVEGFAPGKLMRELTSSNGEKQLYLDVKFRKLWFRLKYPSGKITKTLVKLTEQVAIVESRVYLDKNDAEENYVASAFAQRFFDSTNSFGQRYVEVAETASIGRALADAGFGVQFCDIAEEPDPNMVDSGIPLNNGELEKNINLAQTQLNEKMGSNTNAEVEDKETDDKTKSDEKTKVQTSNKEKQDNKSKEIQINPPKPIYEASTDVEEILKIMTLEEAKNVAVDIGFNKGKTLGQVAKEKPESVTWYINSYKGPNNILRAAAKLIYNTALAS